VGWIKIYYTIHYFTATCTLQNYYILLAYIIIQCKNELTKWHLWRPFWVEALEVEIESSLKKERDNYSPGKHIVALVDSTKCDTKTCIDIIVQLALFYTYGVVCHEPLTSTCDVDPQVGFLVKHNYTYVQCIYMWLTLMCINLAMH